MADEIQLLQFLICKEFREAGQDAYGANSILSNLYVPAFPCRFEKLYVVTCWRKDTRFHKEVLEYETDYGATARSAHMDIEPLKGNVLFRWHAHQFPATLEITKPTTLTIRVILDWKTHFESYIMVEERAA